MLLNPFDDRPGAAGRKVTAILALVAAANAAAWAWAGIAFGDRTALIGTAGLAYAFGLRHAFDADHIAAIDNVVRKLMQDGKAPYTAGFFFSLGHSSIVILASAAIVPAAAAMRQPLAGFSDLGSTIGTSVSALFLLVIGIANLFILKGVWAVFRRARRGVRNAEDGLNTLLSGRGFLARLFRPLFRGIGHSWQLYPVGFLFGLGFDTATEIGVLGIAASQAAQGMPLWTILVFPALFTAGMSLMDTADSVLMTRAYSWAFDNPLRKLWFNLTVTALSVAVAIFIGGIEALGVIGERFGLEGGVWTLVGALNGSLANFGYAVAGIFLAGWLVSLAVYRATGIGDAVPERP